MPERLLVDAVFAEEVNGKALRPVNMCASWFDGR
jgi:hypothetical protein